MTRSINPTAEPFDPSILSSFDRLLEYFHRTPVVQEIIDQAATPPAPLAYGRWKIIRMHITYPFTAISSLFCSALAELILRPCGARKLAIRCQLWGEHLFYSNRKLEDHYRFGVNHLVPSIGQHQKNTKDFYLLPPLPRNTIQDERIRICAEFSEARQEISFTHLNGNCRGMSTWFLFLYRATLEHFQDEEAHLIAIAKQFEQGASREAALMQSLPCLEFTHSEQRAFLELATLNADFEGSVRQALQTLPQAGIFGIGTLFHRINYFKLIDGRSYIFDSAKGLVRMHSTDDIVNYIKQYHVSDDPRFYIFFKQYGTTPVQQTEQVG